MLGSCKHAISEVHILRILQEKGTPITIDLVTNGVTETNGIAQEVTDEIVAAPEEQAPMKNTVKVGMLLYVLPSSAEGKWR